MPDAAPLGDLAPADFLRNYWQKKPLLIREALPGFASPLAPEELAGLALEEDVESRLILEKGGAYPWQLRHGPFEEEDFLNLPETHWTLLVQAVDRLLPEVEALRERFRFVPDWRIDDVMVSYAPEGGSVGAHVDRYDVFLLQGLGRRRWHIGAAPVEDERLVPDLDVRILANFEPAKEYVLGPGDLLYLPPRIAHYGVALDDCMTFSVGFRAPSHEELLSGFFEHTLARLDPQVRFSDPGLTPPAHPGEICPEALDQVGAVIRQAASDEAIDRWFGRFVTAPRRGTAPLPSEAPPSPDDLRKAIRNGGALRRAPGARLAFIRHDGGTATLFADGETHPLPPGLAFAASLLTDRRTLPPEALRPHLDDEALAALLAELLHRGVLEIER